MNLITHYFNMFKLVTLLLYLIVGDHSCVGDVPRFIPVFEEQYESCGHSGFIEWSELKVIPFNDTHVFLDGKVTFLKKVHAPWSFNVGTERYHQGKWHLGEINRKVPDFCALIQDQLEPWYAVTSKMQQKSCPYLPGTVEKFNMVQITDFNINIPATFQGKWRVTIDMLFKDIPGFKKEEECIRFNFEIIEV